MLTESALAALAANVLAERKDEISGLAATLLKHGYIKAKVRLDGVFARYLEATSSRLSRSRSMIFKEEPRYLYDFYVPLDFTSRSIRLVAPTYSNLTAQSNRVLIIGTGGSGKSTFLRHVFLTCLQARNRIPIFVELRDINATKITLPQAILDCLKIGRVDGDPTLVEEMLKTDRFAILLDGVDELDSELQGKVLKEIDVMSQKHPSTDWIVSSRPMDELLSLKQFTQFTTEPLSLDKAVELVNKLGIDHTLAEKFTEELRSSLYEKHETFLSNPLLLSIMLLTYRDNASIPSSLHLFFEQAFYALFNKHDASKGQYERPFKSGLNATDFATSVSAFCIVTYLNRLFSLNESQINKAIEESTKLTKLSVSPPGFKHDLVMGICLLVKDGTTYSFLHRSFQEYFAAVFLNNLESNNRSKLVYDLCLRQRRDLLMSLLWGINRRLIEDTVIVPVLRDLKQAIKYRRGAKAPLLRFMKIMSDEIYVSSHDFPGGSNKPMLTISKDVSDSNRPTDNFREVAAFCYRYYSAVDWGMEPKQVNVEDELIKLSKSMAPADALYDRLFHIQTKKLATNAQIFLILAKSSFVGAPRLDLLMTLLDKLESEHQDIRRASADLLSLRL